MTKYISRAAIAAAAVVLGVSAANAATLAGSGTLTVTAAVAASCSVQGGSLNFGEVGSVNNQAYSTSGSIAVNCPNNLPFTVDFVGTYYNTGQTSRQLAASGGARLNYALYQSTAPSQPLGTDVGGSTLQATGTGSPLPFTLTAQMPQQGTGTPALGVYSDTITINVYY
jgi:spore coat protein U-like protein